MPAQTKVLFAFLIALGAIFLFLPKEVLAQNLLQNPGFEELLLYWEPSSGLEIALNFTTSSYVKKSGEYSALIKHGRTGSYGAQQVVKDIVSGEKYSANGYVFFNNENAKSARIRIAWYSSENGSGSQLKTVDSNVIDTLSSSWQELETGTIEAPSSARSAEFRILIASAEDGVESLVHFDDLNFEIAQQSAPTSTLTPTSSPATGTYKINEVKDENGNSLSSVEVYVDEKYTHHYAPEILTFGNGKYCDNNKEAECDFGKHTIKLEKSGFNNWIEIRTINPGGSYEVSPVMTRSDSVSLSEISPTPTTTPSPRAVELAATLAGEVLGEESTPGGIYLLEPSPSPEASGEAITNNKTLPVIFLGAGLVFFVAAGLSLWYTKWRCPG